MSTSRTIADILRAIKPRVLSWIDGKRPVHHSTSYWTSTNWDGDAKTTANNGVIDLSAAFGLPPEIRGIYVQMEFTSASAGRIVTLGRDSSGPNMLRLFTPAANIAVGGAAYIPCDANGDVYWTCSGDIAAVIIRIIAYEPR